MKKQLPIRFLLRNIKTNQFATIDSVLIDEQSIDLKVNIEFGVDIASRFVGCFAKFMFSCNNAPFLILNASCDFEVEITDWNSLINKESNQITIPVNLLTHFATITTGTARGILHAKTEGTKFNQFYLPTIDITEFVKESVTLSLNN